MLNKQRPQTAKTYHGIFPVSQYSFPMNVIGPDKCKLYNGIDISCINEILWNILFNIYFVNLHNLNNWYNLTEIKINNIVKLSLVNSIDSCFEFRQISSSSLQHKSAIHSFRKKPE